MADVSLSAKYGIPAAMILGHKRYSYCNAVEAVLVDVSDDGKYATYQGVCGCGHLYREKISVEELKRKTRVVIKNGEQVYEYEDKVKISGEQELEEY